MKLRKVISLVISLSILLSAFSISPAFSAESETKELTQREVYLHAFDEKRPVNDTTNSRTVYIGDDVNIYLAVDDPNKSRSDDEPQFDMTGYTVKIYFDTKYFSFPDDSKVKPIDYKYPNDMEGLEEDDIVPPDTTDPTVGSDGSDPSAGSDAGSGGGSVAKPGYFLWRHEESDNPSDRLGYACATVFLLSDGSDNLYSKFPETEGGENYWYNLLKLPLVPKQPGYTSVYIDVDTNDEYTLELFAKNNTPDDALNFDCFAVNDGVFYLTIDDKNKPKPPRPDDDHPAGTYNEEIKIGLQHDNTEKCEIWYSLDGVTDPRTKLDMKTFTFEEGDEISLRSSTVIMAATLRTTDGKWSDVRQYAYDFLPRPPHLFNSDEEIIPNIYSELWREGGYMVSASDTPDFSAGISADSTIYYTFHPSILPDSAMENSGSDPQTQWKKATAGFIAEPITEECTMRLVTVNKWGTSDVAVYHLSVKPDTVTATPGSGLDREQPVVLECETPLADIYYTIDGKDPRNTGTKYTGAITLEKDSVIKSVAKLGNEWGTVSSYWYLFSNTNRSGVSAYSPAGTYVGSVEVTLYPNEPGKAIEVSEDGITWLPYDGKTMIIEEYTRFRARIADETNPSDKGDEFVYVIKPRPPVFSPEGTQFTSSDTVTVFCLDAVEGNDDEYELWYTTDGSEPTSDDKAPSDSVNITITDYTTIKAVVVKDGQYKSDVVTHTYGVVYGKPASPLTTLLPGFYDRTIDGGAYYTQFKEVPDGTDIYYTVSTGDDCTYPDINNPGVETGTYKYNGERIEVIDSMIINAVCVRTINGALIKSENASFHYLITPEAPKAAPSAIVGELGVIPVDAVAVLSEDGKRSVVRYTIENDEDSYSGEFSNDYSDSSLEDSTVRFYIDLSSGRAYRDSECTKPLTKESNVKFSDSVILRISETLDGVDSGEKAYIYSLDSQNAPLIAPYADKESGTYAESKSGFEVKLYSVYKQGDNVKIQWKLSGDSDWTDYDETSVNLPSEDTIIYIRTVEADNEANASAAVGYVYYFVPPAPVITPVSGIYPEADKTAVSISKSADTPDGTYYLYFSQSTEPGWGYVGTNSFDYYVIDSTKTVKAYVKNDTTGRISEIVYESYITETDNILSGAVSIKAPFDKKRISAHLLGTGDYAKGVLFTPSTGVLYNYKYNFTKEAGGGSFESETSVIYNENNAFVSTERMDNLTISVWLDGDRLGTLYTHPIDFVHLSIPTVKLHDTPAEDGTYAKGTKYQVENIYSGDQSCIVYYTTDGSDPTKDTSNRKKFSLAERGPEEILNKSTVVKAVYYSACNDVTKCDMCKNQSYESCPDYVYGEVGTYSYQVPVKHALSSGGGGGGTIDKTRKYTSDIFGTEHPTHIGYINGYPDGSVRPDGNITREEVSAILYRVKPMAYDSPITATGKVFPDVSIDRWSVREIEHLTAYDIIKGYPDGSFLPAENLTRAEFAALIRRFISAAEIKTANKKVNLTDIADHWAFDDITFIAKAGLVEGYEDGTFRPEREITRAEVMSVINRILGRKPLESYVKSQNFNPFTDLNDDKWYYVTVLEATITHDYYLNAQKYEYKWENWK